MTTALLPRDVLNIGTGAGQNHFNEGIGRPGAHTDYSPTQIQNGYSSDPEFKVVILNGIPYVQFRVRADAARTSTNTKYPRSELREFNEAGTSGISFNGGSGNHWMKGKSRIMKGMTVKPWVCFTQIHDANSDLARVQVEGNKIVCRNTPPGSDAETIKTVQASYTFGDEVDWELGINAGAGYLKISGIQVQSFPGNTTGCYNKTGCYSQSGTASGESASDYAVVYLRDLQHFHTGWATPDPISGGGTGGGGTGGGGTVASKPGDMLTLSRWELTLPIGEPGDPTNPQDIFAPALKTFSSDYFKVGTDGAGIQYVEFAAPVTGSELATTSSDSGASRSELREMASDDGGSSGPKASWSFNDSTAHELIVTETVDPTSITNGRRELIIGQIHGATGTPPIYLSCNFNAGTTGKITLFKNGPAVADILTGITATTRFTFKILKTGAGSSSRVQVSYALGNKADLPATPQYDWPISDFTDVTGCYMKAGAYNKTPLNDPDAQGTGRTRVYAMSLNGVGYVVPGSGVGGGGITGAPVAGAGADANHQVNTAFTRTGSDTNSPTSRKWTIVSGPTGVGTTLSTTAALSWTPAQTGTYVLRYSATNAAGTGSDETTVSVTTTGSGGSSGGGSTGTPWTPNYPDGTAYPQWTGGGSGTATNITSLTGTLNSNTVYQYTGTTITTAVNIDFTGKSNITIRGITMGLGGSLTPKAGTNIILRVNGAYENTNGAAIVKWVGVYNTVCVEESLFGPATPAGTPTATKSRFVQWGDSTSVGAKFGCVRRCTFQNKNGPGNPIHTVGDTAQAQGGVRYTLITLNLVKGTKPFDENDHESMLLGISSLQLTDGQQVVEFNRFEDDRSEPEVVSCKMNNSVIRGNTFHNCVGSVSLRHGDDGEINDNWIYGFEEETGAGSYNRTSAGPRMYGARHFIHHNNVTVNGNGGSRPSATALFESPLTIDEGDVAPGSTSNGHANVVNVLVEDNVLAKCGNPIMVTANYSTPPTGTVRNNIVAECANTAADGVGLKGSGASKAGLTISGNQVASTVAAAGLTAGPGGHWVHPTKGARVSYLTASQVGQGSTFDPYASTGGGGTGPSVSAGADAVVANGSQFVRSAAENLNGATATTRTWTIVSGPTGAGTTIGQAPTLTWTPTVNGTYVIRYSLVTSAGTVTDDASIQVTATGGGGTTGVPPSFVNVGAPAGGLTASITPGVPAGAAVGQFEICAIVTSGVEEITTVPEGWELLDSQLITSPAGDPGGPGMSWLYYSTAGTGSVTWVKSGARLVNAVRATWRNQSSLGSHRVRVPSSGAGSNVHTLPTLVPENADSRIVSVVMSDLVNATLTPVDPPSGWTERIENTRTNQTENESIAIADTLSSTTVNGSWTSTNPDEAAVYAFVLEGPIVGGGTEEPITAPIVDAGPDSTVQLTGSPFTATAAENDTGSAVTARSWKILSGPAGVNTVLSSGISVTWSPTAAGTYVLQFSSTNGVGTSTDNVTVTVTTAPPVTPTQKPSARVNGFFPILSQS